MRLYIHILRSIFLYHTRGVPDCHRPHTQTSRSFVTSFRPVPLLPRAPAVPLIRLTPRGQEHPAELHHSGTMMPRHTIGNPRYEATDIRRPVSSNRVHQTYFGFFFLGQTSTVFSVSVFLVLHVSKKLHITYERAPLLVVGRTAHGYVLSCGFWQQGR